MFSVRLSLYTIKPPRLISFWNIKDINIDSFYSRINSISIPDSFSNPDDLLKLYNYSLQDILDSLAPVKTLCFLPPPVYLLGNSNVFSEKLISRFIKQCAITIYFSEKTP